MNTAQLIVFTDLDGTFLDEENYRYDASLPALRNLQALKIPLVLCSSKTKSEMEFLWRELRLSDPFICENGGAIWFPQGYFPFPVVDARPLGDLETIALGTEIALLRRALEESARRLGLKVRSFGEMTAAEVAQLTGLSKEQAAFALQREYDEPFIVEGGGAEELFAALRDRGLTVTFGGRLFHVTGGHDKGHAVSRLRALYQRTHAGCLVVGLGNSGNDLALLRQVDRPILIRSADGSYDRDVLQGLPNIEKTLERGPAGWNTAIAKILSETGSQTC